MFSLCQGLWHWNQLLQQGMATPVPPAPTHQSFWVSNKVMRPPISWARCNVNRCCRKMSPRISLLLSWGQVLSSRWGCLNASGRKTDTKLLRYKKWKAVWAYRRWAGCSTQDSVPLFAMVKAELLLLQHNRTNEMRELPDLFFFFNLSGFPAEVVHSSPTVSSFVKLLQTP